MIELSENEMQDKIDLLFEKTKTKLKELQEYIKEDLTENPDTDYTYENIRDILWDIEELIEACYGG